LGYKWSVASYFRYTRQCPLIAFEADSQLDSYRDSQADILVVDKKRLLTEIEVKISIADLIGIGALRTMSMQVKFKRDTRSK